MAQIFLHPALITIFLITCAICGSYAGNVSVNGTQASGRYQKMTLSQIRQMSETNGQAISESNWNMFRSIFAQFAPDSWVKALEAIPLKTIQCLVKVSARIALKIQYNMTLAAKDNSSFEPDSADMMNKLKKNCKKGFNKVIALEKAINATMQQLPQHVKDIGTEFAPKFKQIQEGLQAGNYTAAKALGVEFVEEVRTITPDERKQMGQLFPKLNGVLTDSRIDQLLNMSIAVLKGNSSLQKNMTQLAQDIFLSGVAAGGMMTAMGMNKETPKDLNASSLRLIDDVKNSPQNTSGLGPEDQKKLADSIRFGGESPIKDMNKTGNLVPNNMVPMSMPLPRPAGNGTIPPTFHVLPYVPQYNGTNGTVLASPSRISGIVSPSGMSSGMPQPSDADKALILVPPMPNRIDSTGSMPKNSGIVPQSAGGLDGKILANAMNSAPSGNVQQKMVAQQSQNAGGDKSGGEESNQNGNANDQAMKFF
ncbi:hypothetical protein DdX_20362 [Ditylenchus destructor]|uniref:Uncharacterized protein n=1 Tax=Ditylenchus destructor TaxID=166010 RepID=A0AAD4QRW3_9BILA|nr:hypothetical protein DdX_20362 [Ditylenchus destructor]